jgi:S-adenosylmethionine-diacylglycerol 3-amino-3-carboxypropyl transferase
MPEPADAWAQAAAKLPIAFSQVREDPRVDEAALQALGAGARVFMIASGGDTASALAAGGRVGHLTLVDLNPAQLALTRLKLRLLRFASPVERLKILGHLPMAGEDRARALAGHLEAEELRRETLGDVEFVARVGPDRAGRYEILFDHLRDRLIASDSERLCRLTDPRDQAQLASSDTAFGRSLDAAFAETMRLENLVCLFGEGATQNAAVSFASHFTERTRSVLGRMPARENPFLAQLLHGAFINDVTYDWLQRAAPSQWPEIVCKCASAIEALSASVEDAFDFIHLSNILDWLSPKDAAETLALTWRALRPGGRTIIRQLNSTLDIPAAEPRFTWLEEASVLHAADRSFFYRELFVGEKSTVR